MAAPVGNPISPLLEVPLLCLMPQNTWNKTSLSIKIRQNDLQNISLDNIQYYLTGVEGNIYRDLEGNKCGRKYLPRFTGKYSILSDWCGRKYLPRSYFP